MSEPWEADLDAIMDKAIEANNLRGHYEYGSATRKAVEHAIVGCPGTELRTLLAKAWQAGFTAAGGGKKPRK